MAWFSSDLASIINMFAGFIAALGIAVIIALQLENWVSIFKNWRK